jgi:hypothetical protein
VTPDDDRQQTWRGTVRAFNLVAAALANPVPKVLADLTATEETLRDLEREPPLTSFSPFGALPEDIAYDKDQPFLPPAGAAGTSALFTEHEATRFDDEWSGAPSETQPLVFSFRRRNRDVQEGPRDGNATRGHSRVPGVVPEEPEYPAPSGSERPEMKYVRRNEDFAEDTLQSAASSMLLLDDLAEDALGAGKSRVRDVPAHTANTPPQAIHSREPDRESYGDKSAAQAYPPAGRDGRWEGSSGTATDPRKTEPGDGGITALVDSLAENLFSSQIRTPTEPVVREHSAFAPPDNAFDEPAGGPLPGSSAPGMDDGVSGKVSGQYVDPEALAALINDVLVRQARRHGVDLS